MKNYILGIALSLVAFTTISCKSDTEMKVELWNSRIEEYSWKTPATNTPKMNTTKFDKWKESNTNDSTIAEIEVYSN